MFVKGMKPAFVGDEFGKKVGHSFLEEASVKVISADQPDLLDWEELELYQIQLPR